MSRLDAWAGRFECRCCGRWFDTSLGLDVHRRNGPPGCHYERGEPTAGWRPGLLALPGVQGRPR